MSDDHVSAATRTKLARSVLRNNLRVKPGETVVVEAWTHTLPWAVTFAREVRRMGAMPLVPYEDEDMYWDAVKDGGDKLLGKAAAHEWAALAKTDVYIHMWGPGDRVRLNSIPDDQADHLFAYNNSWYNAASKAGLRGARMEIGRPYPSLARAYGYDLSKWTDQLVRATMYSPDKLERAVAPVARALERGKRLHIYDDNGTDLTLGLAKRKAATYTGRPNLKKPFQMLTTLPTGSLRVALDETVAEGTIVGNRTNYYDDAKATGGVFRFRRGKLTDAEYEHGGERFKKAYKTGGKGRDRPGIFSIGFNPELHNTPQVEDVELGAVMMSVGGNKFFRGKNTSPLFAWVTNVGATVEVDGKKLSFTG
ncbi:MAG: aminopeptidase [Thermoplasmata archaeon]|jgi:leucyl aminopeptidase (aminopeptidase T)